jgi:hypothetical protein
MMESRLFKADHLPLDGSRIKPMRLNIQVINDIAAHRLIDRHQVLRK